MTPPLSRFAIAAPSFVCASSPSQAPDSRAMIGPGAAPCHDLIISGIKLLPWLNLKNLSKSITPPLYHRHANPPSRRDYS